MKNMQKDNKIILGLALAIILGTVMVAAARGEIGTQHEQPKNCIALAHQEQDKLSADASVADQNAAYQADTNAFELCDTGE